MTTGTAISLGVDEHTCGDPAGGENFGFGSLSLSGGCQLAVALAGWDPSWLAMAISGMDQTVEVDC